MTSFLVYLIYVSYLPNTSVIFLGNITYIVTIKEDMLRACTISVEWRYLLRYQCCGRIWLMRSFFGIYLNGFVLLPIFSRGIKLSYLTCSCLHEASDQRNVSDLISFASFRNTYVSHRSLILWGDSVKIYSNKVHSYIACYVWTYDIYLYSRIARQLSHRDDRT